MSAGRKEGRTRFLTGLKTGELFERRKEVRETTFHVETHADPRRRAPGCSGGDGERRRDQDAGDSHRGRNTVNRGEG